MRVQVVCVEDAGVVVVAEGDQGNQFWLPREEWDKSDRNEWQMEHFALTAGEELDVVLAVTKKRVSGRQVVSRTEYSFTDVQEDWLHDVRRLCVESSSERAVVGHVGSVRAFAEMAPYLSFLNNRVLPEWAKDHGILGKGDYIEGFVQEMSTERSSVVMNIGDYLESSTRKEADQTPPNIREEGAELLTIQHAPFLPKETQGKLSPLLLVENHDEFRSALKATLEGLALCVDTASDEEEAREKLLNGSFRLIMIDVNLRNGDNDKNGFALLESQQARDDRKLVLLTGEFPTQDKLSRWGHLRVHGYIRKPCTPQEVADTLVAAVTTPGVPWREFESTASDTEEENQQGEASAGLQTRAEISKEEAVAELGRSERGSVIHVFEMHPRSFRARSVAEYNGAEFKWTFNQGKLGKSVIKDTAVGGEAFIDHEPLNAGKHKWTLSMMNYRSFVGMPIPVTNACYKYALVAFHKDADALGGNFLSLARLCVERVGRALERVQLHTIGEEQSRYAATGMALESLAHEIKNEISTITHTCAQLIGVVQKPTMELSAADIDKVREMSTTLSKVALVADEETRLLTGTKAEKGYVNVYDCLCKAASRCRAIADLTLPKADRIHIDIPRRNTKNQWNVWGSPAALIIVFFNLYLNAAQQIDMLTRTGIRRRGNIWHTCERYVDENGKELAVVCIHDTGPGIHREDWDLIFRPGYTTKEGGSGLGLHICRNLVKGIGSGGRRANLMVTRSTIWGGTTFTVMLPLVTVSDGE